MAEYCWRCAGEPMPENGAQRFALCEVHLAERIRALMGILSEPQGEWR